MSSFSNLVEQYDLKALRNSEILATFERETGYEIVQSNGQRICGPPVQLKSKPILLKGTEVFVGKLPRDCLENEIFLFCSRAGEIYQMRLMVNFSGDNRGYCFVKYCTFQSAYNAVQILNNTYIRPGHRVGVALSSDNTKINVFRLNPEVTYEDIIEELTAKTEGFIDCQMMNMPCGEKQVILDYEDHRNSALAKRYIKTQIGEGRWGKSAVVKWAFCPLTQARNRKKKENKMKQLKHQQIMEHMASASMSAHGSCDSMSVGSDKENSKMCISWPLPGVPSRSSTPYFQQYPILGRHNQQSFNEARSVPSRSSTPYFQQYPILGQHNQQSFNEARSPMTESGYNMRPPLSSYSESLRPSATSSLLQKDDEAEEIALMPPHFDIMGRTQDNASQWPVIELENLMNEIENLELNTSNVPPSASHNIKPQQYNNSTVPELPNRFNNLNYTPNAGGRLNVLPDSLPLPHTSNPSPLGAWTNFNQNPLVNKYPIRKRETSYQYLNNNESEISYSLPKPTVKNDTMLNTALETSDRSHYVLQRSQIVEGDYVFGLNNNFQSYNVISEQDGRQSRNGVFNRF